MTETRHIDFLKMEGAGNDFPVFDLRGRTLRLNSAVAAAAGDRRFGIGGDQVIAIEPAQNPGADAFMRIFNHTGDEVEACGNATRAVARYLMDESGKDQVTIETVAGRLVGHDAGGCLVRVDMGEPSLEAAAIPLSENIDTVTLPITLKVPGLPTLQGPGAVNMGNPHMVFTVEDAAAYPLEEIGPLLEHHALYPQRCNVSLAEVRKNGSVSLRVWERSAGITLACGSAACATLVALHRQGHIGREAAIDLPGGRLQIAWDDQNHIHMTGPVRTAFTGIWEWPNV
ncbi:MAG: diaminopimelate epimerase [Alphaproteobacteria bacterium]